MLLSKKIKLEVSEQDAAALEFMQGKCRGLYNWWVMRLRDGRKWPGAYEAKKTLQESRQYDPELMQPMPLWVRTYRCKNCGLVMDRDENSAHNILARAILPGGQVTSPARATHGSDVRAVCGCFHRNRTRLNTF